MLTRTRDHWQGWVAGIMLACLLLALAGRPARADDLELPVPRVTIYPGEPILDDQLVERAFIARTVARTAVFDGRQALVGKVARRTLLAGQPIPLNAVREPYAVNQGKPALVVFEAAGLTITSQATALQNGSIGELVSLRNDDSGTVIKGTVAPDGTVRLAAP
jgi:flagellar basal body P-ring formation protein FlgA